VHSGDRGGDTSRRDRGRQRRPDRCRRLGRPLVARGKNQAGSRRDRGRRLRDIDESRDLEFPVYGRAAVQVTARGRIMQQSFNQEIQFAGIQVHPAIS